MPRLHKFVCRLFFRHSFYILPRQPSSMNISPWSDLLWLMIIRNILRLSRKVDQVCVCHGEPKIFPM